MRLIDADELIKEFLNVCRTEFEIKNKCLADENVLFIIQNAPTVESYQDKERVTIEMSEEEIERFRQMLIDIFKDILKEAKNDIFTKT